MYYFFSLLIEGLDYVKATLREKQRFAHVLQGMKDAGTHHMRDEYLLLLPSPPLLPYFILLSS